MSTPDRTQAHESSLPAGIAAAGEAAPEVSVVVPTRNRPHLVTRAVRSALAQSVRDIEVVVVVDGPDKSTPEALAAIGDPRVRVVRLPRRRGASNARNVGAEHARGRWTALLDDDDEWLPDKLAVQLKLAAGASAAAPVVTCRLTMRTPRADLVMPRRLPDDGEPLSEYFTVRRGLFHGEGFIQTSTIMAPTELLRLAPFTVGLPRAQELDWALRVFHREDVELVVAPEPLVIWHADEDRARISSTSPWREMVEWLRRSRPLMTRRAYAALAMSVISSMAATTRSPRVFWTLLREARRHGRPKLIDYVTYLQIWLIPPDLRRTLRDLIKGRRDSGEQSGARLSGPANLAPPSLARAGGVRASLRWAALTWAGSRGAGRRLALEPHASRSDPSPRRVPWRLRVLASATVGTGAEREAPVLPSAPASQLINRRALRSASCPTPVFTWPNA